MWKEKLAHLLCWSTSVGHLNNGLFTRPITSPKEAHDRWNVTTYLKFIKKSFFTFSNFFHQMYFNICSINEKYHQSHIYLINNDVCPISKKGKKRLTWQQMVGCLLFLFFKQSNHALTHVYPILNLIFSLFV